MGVNISQQAAMEALRFGHGLVDTEPPEPCEHEGCQLSEHVPVVRHLLGARSIDAVGMVCAEEGDSGGWVTARLWVTNGRSPSQLLPSEARAFGAALLAMADAAEVAGR